MALKLGRQQRIQIIDGQQVEVLTEGEFEDEEDEEDDDDDYEEEDISIDEEGLRARKAGKQGGAGGEGTGAGGQNQFVVLEVVEVGKNSSSGFLFVPLVIFSCSC